jgi:hypothetical protein
VPDKTVVEDVQGEGQSRQQALVATAIPSASNWNWAMSCSSTCTLYARSGGGGGKQNKRKAIYMKRVLLLVCLIVSLVELDWERYRIYLLCSIASLLLVLGSELMRGRSVQRVATERAFRTVECIPSEPCAADSPSPDDKTDSFGKVESTSMAKGFYDHPGV